MKIPLPKSSVRITGLGLLSDWGVMVIRGSFVWGEVVSLYVMKSTRKSMGGEVIWRGVEGRKNLEPVLGARRF
jgi:hypothetical protein